MVGIFLHRRPVLVGQLLEAVAPHQPSRIWLVADGPRNSAEEAACEEARAAAEKGISWPCEVHRVYARENLGLRRRLETGLDEIFAREESAILLEDDCHPTEDFFPFCGEMLGRYANEDRVGGISGNCFLPASVRMETDYFFSRYLHIWGWATWARAWRDYRRKRRAWPAEGFRELFPSARTVEANYWNRIYQRVDSGEINTWDYPWVADLWRRGMVSVTPAQNLIHNRGFGPEATHTKDTDVQTGMERWGRLRPPFRGPLEIRVDEALDRAVFENHFLRTEGKLSLLPRLLRSLRKRLGRA